MKGEEERKCGRRKLEKTKPLEEKQRGEHNREKSVREDPVTTKTHNMKSCSQLGSSPRTAMVVLFTFCTLSVT